MGFWLESLSVDRSTKEKRGQGQKKLGSIAINEQVVGALLQ